MDEIFPKLDFYHEKIAVDDLTTQMALGPVGQKRRSKPLEGVESPDAKQKSHLDAAYAQWRADPSGPNIDAVLKEASPIMGSAISSYAGSDSPLYRSYARRLVINSLDSYDPNKKIALKTWLMSNLRGLTRYRTNMSIIKMPERIRYERTHIDAARSELGEILGRPPSPVELADHTGLSTKRIHYIDSLVGSVANEGVPDGVGHDTFIPGAPEDSGTNIWTEYVYHDLDPIDQQIYDMTVGHAGQTPATRAEIGAKLNLSPGALTYRSKRIAAKLSQALHHEESIGQNL